MFPVRVLVFTVFTAILFCDRQSVYGECNGLTTFLNTSQNGSINMFMDRYDYRNQSCTWLITIPTGQRVLVYFTAIRLEDCYRCGCSSVTVSDGRYRWSPRLAKYCGRDLPRPVYSTGREVLITFQPSFGTYEHFTLHYSTLFYFLSACPPIVPGASAGVIYNPYFPEYYSFKKKCDWFIKVPPFEQININFTYIYPYGDCTGHVEIFDMYGQLKRVVTLCATPVPSSVKYSESVHVRYYPDLSSSSFLAFYQIGYSVPNPVSTYAPPPTWYTTQSHTHCQPYSEKSIFLQSAGSTSLSSSVDHKYMHTVAPDTTCTWRISTTEDYTLELKFDEMHISSCSGCSCGHVIVRDGSRSSARSLGTFCNGNVPSVVSSTGNHMYILFYAERSWDYFKASIDSKETKAHQRQRIAGIVVPIVIGLVLFVIIVSVIKCTKIRRSTGQEGSSQIPLLLEPTESSPDDEEMIDLTEDNNATSGTSETA